MDECNVQTKHSPVAGFNDPTHKQAAAQDILETHRENFKGLISDPSSPRIKLGELEPPRLKALNNVMRIQVAVKRYIQMTICFHWWGAGTYSWKVCCSYW
jgi:hypothetical protein